MGFLHWIGLVKEHELGEYEFGCILIYRKYTDRKKTKKSKLLIKVFTAKWKERFKKIHNRVKQFYKGVACIELWAYTDRLHSFKKDAEKIRDELEDREDEQQIITEHKRKDLLDGYIAKYGIFLYIPSDDELTHYHKLEEKAMELFDRRKK